MTPYINAEEALVIIGAYMTTDEKTVWSALSPEDQKAMLMRAMLQLESMRYVGRKVDYSQIEAFPRIIVGVDVGVPPNVKAALALQAFENLIQSPEAAKLAELGKIGVTSYRLDDFSVSFSASRLTRNPPLSQFASQLLEPYLLKGGPVHVA